MGRTLKESELKGMIEFEEVEIVMYFGTLIDNKIVDSSGINLKIAKDSAVEDQNDDRGCTR